MSWPVIENYSSAVHPFIHSSVHPFVLSMLAVSYLFTCHAFARRVFICKECFCARGHIIFIKVQRKLVLKLAIQASCRKHLLAQISLSTSQKRTSHNREGWGKSVKSCEIRQTHEIPWNSLEITLDLSVQHIWNLSRLLELFNCHKLDTSSQKQASNILKLPRIDVCCEKLGTSHDIKSFATGSFLDGTCIVVERANDYLCHKNIKNAGQNIAKPIIIDFLHNLPRKYPQYQSYFFIIFYFLRDTKPDLTKVWSCHMNVQILREVYPENSCENPPKSANFLRICPWKSRKTWLFSLQSIRGPD